MRNDIPEKTITIPNFTVNITPVKELVDSEQLQEGRYKKQVGLVERVYPGANHTRFEHPLGVYYTVKEDYAKSLKLDPELVLLLSIAALFHDVGHGPFSHQVEPLVIGEDHESRGLKIVHEFKTEIGKRVDFDRFVEIFSKKDPLSKIIYDRNLGADKLDYLFRDDLHMGIGNWSYARNKRIIEYLIYDSDCGRLGIDEKMEHDVMALQNHYVYMHAGGYLRKKSVIDQRMFQRSIEEMLKANPELDLMGLNDVSLINELINSENKLAKNLYQRLISRRGDSLKAAVVLKIEGYGERINGKDMHLVALPEEQMNKFNKKYENVRKVSILEDEVADELGINQGELLIATMQFADRILPKDVWLFSKNKGWHSLFKKKPYHEETLQNQYKDSFAIRVITTEDKRRYVSERTEEITDIILDKIN